MRLESPSVLRNREPLFEVLRTVLPSTGTLVELAAGSGEHAVCFASRFPGIRWIPTDVDPAALASIAAWRIEAGIPNLEPPRSLDASATDWGLEAVDVILAINLIHYVRWDVARGLFAGAGRLLGLGGLVVTYGAYRVGGRHTAPSNEAFDAWLHARDPASGVRDLERVVAEAAQNGLRLASQVAMPANNFTLVFER